MNRLMQIMFILLTPGFSAISTGGQISEGTYYNKYVGLHFPIPAGWYLATSAEVKKGLMDGAQIMGLDSEEARSVVQQMPGKILLMLSERPLNSNLQDFNRNMIVAAIDVRDHGDEIRTGEDYLGLVAEGMKQSLPNAVISEVGMKRLGGVVFHKLDVELPVYGIIAHQTQLARVANDYLVIVNISAGNSMDLDGLMQIADRFRFSSVPQTVDDSTEGRAFRKQAAVMMPGSSGGMLKHVGIVLMVLGGFWAFAGEKK